jgi:hypothetical protein
MVGPMEQKRGRQSKAGAEIIEELRKANAELKGKMLSQNLRSPEFNKIDSIVIKKMII